MIGKAAVSFIPSSAIRIMQGAKRPIPSVISAPRNALPAIATARRPPERPSASPPPGHSLAARAAMMPAARISSTPMPIWIRRRGQRDTTPAPSQAPSVAAATIAASVVMSTSTTRMKMKASAKVGIMCPTFSVPGMFSSATACPSLYSDVVVANEPMPSVSKKFVTKPIAIWPGVGRARAPAARGWRAQIAMNAIPIAASTPNSSALADGKRPL